MTNFDDLCNLVVLEQFKNMLPGRLATFVSEQKVITASVLQRTLRCAMGVPAYIRCSALLIKVQHVIIDVRRGTRKRRSHFAF